ncbi:hypothetical protein NQL31_005150 [Lotmaria passim]
MWESLPPVASSSATPSTEIPGISVATHSTGMISGASAAPPSMDPASTPTLLSRSPANNNSNSSSHTRPLGAASAPVLPTTVGAPTAATTAAVVTETNRNSSATPREASLTSVLSSGTHDLSARSNLNGASPAPQFFPPVTITTLCTVDKAEQGDNNRYGGSGASRSNSNYCTNVNPATMMAPAVVDVTGSSERARDSLATPHTSSIAMASTQNSRAFSAVSMPRCSSRPQQQQWLPQYLTAQSLSSAPPLSESTMPPPSVSTTVSGSAAAAVAGSVGHRPNPSTTSPPLLTFTTVAAQPGAAAAPSPTINQSVRTSEGAAAAAAAAGTTRCVSPRRRHTNSESSAMSASPMSPLKANAPWQSPGLISITSARLNSNDPTSLYVSSSMLAHVRERSSGQSETEASASGPRMAPPVVAAPYCQSVHNGNTNGVNDNTIVSTVSAAGMSEMHAARLDLVSSQVDANAPPSTAAGPPTRLPQTFASPTHYTVAVPNMLTTTTNTTTAAEAAGSTDEVSNNNSVTMTSDTSLTFASPHFHNTGSALEESLVSSSVSGAPPKALTTAARPPNSSTPVGSTGTTAMSATACGTAASPAATTRTPQSLRSVPSAAPTMSTKTGITSGSPAGPPAGGVFPSLNPTTHALAHRGSSDVVFIVGTEPTLSISASAAASAAAPAPPPPSATNAAAAGGAAVSLRERSADVRHRYAVPSGVGNVNGMTASLSGMLTPNADNAAALTPPSSSAVSHPAHGRPFSASQDTAGSTAAQYVPPHLQHHRVSVAGGVVPSPLSHTSVASHHDLSLPFAQISGSQNNYAPRSGRGGVPVTETPSFTNACGAAREGLHASFAAGCIDHNQSFYFGTTGNDNLRRSFFFPPTARPSIVEREEGAETRAAGDVEEEEEEGSTVAAVGHSFDFASYIRHPVPVAGAGSVERTGTSHAPALAVSARSTTSPAATEATESGARHHPSEGDRYCSPVLYRVPSFPLNSPVQLALTQQQQQQQPSQPLSSSSQQAAPPGPQRQDNMSEKEPLRVATGAPGTLGGRPYQTSSAVAAANSSISVSAPSPYTHPLSMAGAGAVGGGVGGGVNTATHNSVALHRSGSARVTLNLPESLRSSANANQSFISPTLANSTMKRRFDDSMASVSEVSFVLPESCARAEGRAAAKKTTDTTSTTSSHAKASVSPYVSSAGAGAPAGTAAACAASSGNFSSPPTPQRKAAAPAMSTAAAGPIPAHVLDWEHSLIAFQNRAESYYIFKNLCTETYLTLIEHDVDRFLVCYYSGGAVKPAEAVQEALASRAGTPAATSSHVFSSSSSSGGGPSSGNTGRGGGGLQKMLQTSKTLQRLSEAGSKWLTSLKKTAMTPVPVWGDAKTPPSSPSSAADAATLVARGGGGGDGCNVASNMGSTAAATLAATRSLPSPPRLDGAAKPVTEASEEWWMTAEANTSGCSGGADDRGAEPTYSTVEPPSLRRGGMHHVGFQVSRTENTSSDVTQLLDLHPSSSGCAVATTSTQPDALSPTSSSAIATTTHSGPAAAGSDGGGAVVVGTPKKAPLSRLSYNIAAEEELQCLRRLGAYMANVIPETYMDTRPSEQVLQHVRRNYPIILHALQHVLVSAAESPTPHARHAADIRASIPSSAAAEAAKSLIASRIRQGLLMPSIQATWRDYLSPLEMKAKELVQIATLNIDPILNELQATSTEDVSATAEAEARQRLRALREQPVRRLVRLLRGDEEYLTTIHVMDDEFIENGEAWRKRSAAMRGSRVALSDYVPVYGLVLSRLHRLEIEHRTVLELWCGGVQSALG